jgi:hypothetical protein
MADERYICFHQKPESRYAMFSEEIIGNEPVCKTWLSGEITESVVQKIAFLNKTAAECERFGVPLPQPGSYACYSM